MGETKDKVQGSIKEGAGKLLDDNSLAARGRGQKRVGKVKESGRKVRGAVEEAIGKVAGDPGKERKGKVRKA